MALGKKIIKGVQTMENRNFAIQCLFVAWAIGIISYGLATKYDPELFSRFGSLIVLFAVIAEFSLLQNRFSYLNECLRNYGGFDAGTIGETQPEERHKKQEIMAHITVAAGTFFWGFGDLLVAMPNK